MNDDPRPRWRLPAEWEPHAGTWLSWPHNRETWPGAFREAEGAMVELAAALSEAETVHINVLDGDHETHVRRLLEPFADMRSIETHLVPTDDAWIRDHGAVFVLGAGGEPGIAALDFEFDAWGRKYEPFDLDAAVAKRMAGILGVTRLEPGIVLEGGAVDGNGEGAILTTEQCLAASQRNEGFGAREYEAVFRRYFGADRTIWLGAGIEGDDTDGHVDQLARFVARARVLAAVERDSADVNYAPLAENRRRLGEARLPTGEALEVLDVPMPAPVHGNGMRLPASYLNFYIANDLVLVPAFGCAADDEARSTVAACFPARRARSVDCRGLVEGLGSIHCLTQQVPAVAGRAGIP